jgi:hypothetical protein
VAIRAASVVAVAGGVAVDPRAGGLAVTAAKPPHVTI